MTRAGVTVHAERWTWRRVAIAVGWSAAVVAGAAYVVSRAAPRGPQPLPRGWRVWRQPGSTRGLVVTPDAALAGGTEGLFELLADGSARRVSIPGTGRPLVHALLLDERGALWVGHSEGLSVRSGQRWTTLREGDGLPHSWVVSLAVTRDGWLWAGTVKGAFGLPLAGPWGRGTLRRMTAEDGLLHDTVLAVLGARDGALWVGNYAAPRGGLSRLQDGRWQHWTPKEGLPHANVAALLEGRDGRVWAGCGLRYRGGVAAFRPEGARWVLEGTVARGELAGAKVSSLFEDAEGRLWLGHEFDGLTVRLGGETLCTLSPAEGLPGREVMAMARGADGSMWLGTDGGVARLSGAAVGRLLGGGDAESEESEE